ncbi:hypothetical protein C1646_688001 [Rhizophagus diaphanus]|nr:hypothetical protein C1646_688001 [Rhizophagus diaphanus] [Rhizophagus sp. MUCL 43196]
MLDYCCHLLLLLVIGCYCFIRLLTLLLSAFYIIYILFIWYYPLFCYYLLSRPVIITCYPAITCCSVVPLLPVIPLLCVVPLLMLLCPALRYYLFPVVPLLSVIWYHLISALTVFITLSYTPNIIFKRLRVGQCVAHRWLDIFFFYIGIFLILLYISNFILALIKKKNFSFKINDFHYAFFCPLHFDCISVNCVPFLISSFLSIIR